MNRLILWSSLQLAIRASAAAGISVAIAHSLHLQHPIFALIAAVIVTDLDPAQSRKLGLRRIVSTIIGAVCGAALSSLFQPAFWGIPVGILTAMTICVLLGAHEGAKVAGYTCAIVLLDNSSTPWEYASYRFVETALGIVVAWIISYVPKLIQLEQHSKRGIAP